MSGKGGGTCVEWERVGCLEEGLSEWLQVMGSGKLVSRMTSRGRERRAG